MRSLCSLSKETANKALIDFNQTPLVSTTALSRSSFQSQTSSIMVQFVQQTPHFSRTLLSFATEMMASLLVPTAFNDWILSVGNASDSFLIRGIPRTFINSTCNCLISRTCRESLRIGPPHLTLPGLMVGCYPLDGLRMSTLECFYSSDCIAIILNHLDYYMQINGSIPIDFVLPNRTSIPVTPLNILKASRFSMGTSVGELIDELFIEQWLNSSAYGRYFVACAPNTCRYQFVARKSILHVTASVLSLYGGLSIGLRSIIWYASRIYATIKIRFTARVGTAVIPIQQMHPS